MYCPDEMGLEYHAKFGGDKLLVICPFHDDSNPSAVFNLTKGDFYCFTCGKFANKHQLAKQTGGSVSYTRSRRIKAKARPESVKNLLALVKRKPLAYDDKYLVYRGVDNKTVKKLQIRQDDWAIYMPQYANGEVVSYIARRKQAKKYKYMKVGKQLPVYPFSALEDFDRFQRLYVVENTFGAIRGLQFGHQVVSTFGVNINSRVGSMLRGFRDIVLLFDPDEAGLKGYKNALSQIPYAQCAAPMKSSDELNQKQWQKLLLTDYEGIKTFYQDILDTE